MDDGGNFLTHMLQNCSRLVGLSLISLASMLLWTFADIAVRGVRFCAAMWQSRGFLKTIAALLERGEWDSVAAMAETRERSHVATLILNALLEFRAAHESVSAEQLMDVVKGAARIATNRLHEELRQGLSVLDAIATTAPLVGLFGTAIGILDSFRGYVGSKFAYLAFITTNLAEALVPTTAGLLVAVFVMWWFNWRSDRLAVFEGEMEIASLELVKYLEQQRRAGKL
jgi:biopolymer transport protein ExbB/TolQ